MAGSPGAIIDRAACARLCIADCCAGNRSSAS